MAIKRIIAVFFSPTGTTEKVATIITDQIARALHCDSLYLNITQPNRRESPLAFTPDDLVVFGMPVYAGRVPNVLVKYLNTMQGNGARAVAIVVYGNRDYDDALMESCDILEHDNMNVVAAAAFIGEHSFSYTLAANRPDNDDIEKATSFANRIVKKISDNDFTKPKIKGTAYPYRPHFRPTDASRNTFDFRNIKPKTNDNCVNCGLCARLCPMGSIDSYETSSITGICIKCGACVKRCPVHAKHFDDPNYIYHKSCLEDSYQRRNEAEWFI